ncbi:CHAT domain-containing protein, partial [Streptomyces rubiginosohelvolus]
MTQVRAEDFAYRILRQAERAEADPGALEWFTGPEAARAADEVLGSLTLPDGSTWGLGLLALGYADLFRYAARGSADRSALATALLRFSVIREQDPDRVPTGLRPVFATLAGAPDGAATEAGLAYDAGVGMMGVFQQSRDPEVLRWAEVLLRHAATAFGGGSVE